jgi:chemotaxis protein MotB
MILIEPESVPKPAAPPWMITFADLLSLLLAFFVMLFATTSVETGEWRRVMAPISAYLTGRAPAAPSAVVVARPGPPGHDQGYVTALVEERVARSPALAGAVATRLPRGIAVTLPAPPRQAAALADLGRLAAGLDNRIEIVVHAAADPSPGAVASEAWRNAAEHALALAGTLSEAAGNRVVEAGAMVDLEAGTGAERVDLLVRDEHAGP